MINLDGMKALIIIGIVLILGFILLLIGSVIVAGSKRRQW